jgi:putative FmdB family regulatory protein
MPTYGYRCSGCGDEFERFQKITDDALTECEQCGGVLKKRIYPIGIQFKGSGFYVNDSRPAAPTESVTPAVAPATAADTTTSTKDAPSAESKPAVAAPAAEKAATAPTAG